jgi:cell wall-associated NlpC family hydrolase
LIVLGGTSCKSLKSFSSKDLSANKNQSANTANKKVTFIDNIEVTPGGFVPSINKPNYITTKKNSKPTTAVKNNSYNSNAEVKSNKSVIEDVNSLQIKYALLLDATVEKLTNIELLRKVDYWWGVKYCLGGSTENCIDCSAFTQVILKDVFDVVLPRTAQEQYKAAISIDLNELQEGDLVFFKTGSRSRQVSHVGVFLLNNKFVHASTSNGVMISDLNDSYWRQHFKGCGRVRVGSN